MDILVKLSKDYANEFDCEMFRVFKAENSIDELKARLVAAATKKEDKKFYFGTSPSDFDGGWGSAKYIELTESEADTIIRLFGVDFGTGSSYFDKLLDDDEDE